MDVRNHMILIHSPSSSRLGWAKAFKQMTQLGDDKLLDAPPIATRWDKEEWEWK